MEGPLSSVFSLYICGEHRHRPWGLRGDTMATAAWRRGATLSAIIWCRLPQPKPLEHFAIQARNPETPWAPVLIIIILTW
eukprot:SAG11_NODE_6922_length_1224_cov_1.208889_1_plen_80_part_00